MPTVKDFKQLATLNGVKHYILVRRDGLVVAENMEDAVSLSSTIVMSGINGESMEENMGGQRYKYLLVERGDGENLIVFSLGNYFLGIVEELNYDSVVLVNTVIGFLKALTRKEKNHPGIA